LLRNTCFLDRCRHQCWFCNWPSSYRVTTFIIIQNIIIIYCLCMFSYLTQLFNKIKKSITIILFDPRFVGSKFSFLDVMKIPVWGGGGGWGRRAALPHAGGRTDTTKLICSFHDFANEPKN
jgi:hypothetical protein